MKFKSFALLSTALVAVTAMPVMAQTADKGESAAANTEVVVIGIRHSLQTSVQTKKKTDAIVDVITAEDVGKFPDTNVAESLSHLPGFAVDRQFGEGERVSILGTDPALNRIFIDGHNIASADWGGNPGDISGRNFNYALLAPEIIGQAKAYHSPEAWIDEGSLGGTVMIDTRKPLDLKSGTLAASAGYEYNDRSEKGNARGSILYSWHDDAKKLGIMVAATYDKEELYRAGIEYFGYSGGDSLDGSFTTTKDQNGTITSVTGPNINGAAPTPASYQAMNAARMPCCINFAYFDQTRERKGLSGTVQWRPDDNTEFDLTALHINGDYTNFSQSEYSVAVWGSPASDITVANGLVTGAKIAGTGYIGFNPSNPTAPTHYNTNAQLDNNLRHTTVVTDYVDLQGKWHFDSWDIHADIGTTRATGGKDPEYLSSFQYGGGYQFGFDQNHTYQNYDNNPADPTTFYKSDLRNITVNGKTGYYTQIGGIGYEIYTDKETYGQADFAKTLNSGFFTKVLFGFKSSDHDNSDWSHGYNVYLTAPTDLSKWDYTESPSNLWDGLGASGNATHYATLTRNGLMAMLNSGIISDNGLNYGSMFDVNEMIQAGYLQGNFATGKLHGNMGFRAVRTRDQSDYWEYNQNTNTWAPRSVTQDDTRLLPAVNLVYTFSDDLLLKGGVAKVMARPRYGQLAGSFSVDNHQLTGGGGNPNLHPYLSTNYEVSLERYFGGNKGMVSGELFYRDISSYIVSKTEDKVLFNTDTGSTSTYSITSPFNAQNAKVHGLDVQYQSDLIWGFGLATNVTFAEADVPTKDYYMPYLSKYTVNVIPYYEKGPWQVRLSYSFRSKYFTQIGRLSSKDYTDDYTQVDLSANYKINDRVSLYAKGLNLLDETYYQFSSVTIAPTSFYKNGRQFMFGFNYKM